jgi:hypothetical protein
MTAWQRLWRLFRKLLYRIPMSYCKEYCIDMPDDFPADELTEFLAVARQKLLLGGNSPEWKELGGASNLIGWRFRACSEDWLTLKNSHIRYGESAGHEELYVRERALFGMFASGVSSMESATYAIAAFASHPNVLGLAFGPGRQRNCNLKNLTAWLTPHTKAKSVVDVLTRICNSVEWTTWIDLRNRMTHRGNLPRIIVGAVGAPAPKTKPLYFDATSSTQAIESDIADFERLKEWLAASLKDLLSAAKQIA